METDTHRWLDSLELSEENTELPFFDSEDWIRGTDWSRLDGGASTETANLQTNVLISGGVRVEWHKNDAVLNLVLEILQSRTCPNGVPIFKSNPDYDTLLHYFGQNRDAGQALYVVQTKSTSFSSMLDITERRMNDWGNAIENHPRFHLLGGKWIFNMKTAPAGATASLLCRGGDYRKAIKKHPFTRLLKPWRCVDPPTRGMIARTAPGIAHPSTS